jgi:hypothetical protein
MLAIAIRFRIQAFGKFFSSAHPTQGRVLHFKSDGVVHLLSTLAS